MMGRVYGAKVGLWLIALGLLLLPQAAWACGIPLNVELLRERALLVVQPGTHQLIASVDLARAEPNAALVFPVPAEPTVDQPAGGALLFSELAWLSRPDVRFEDVLIWAWDIDETTQSAGGGVDLLGRETIGGFDVARIAAADPGALGAWLSANGFTLPAEAIPILDTYAAEGWSFVAVRLAPNAPDGALSPLRFTYADPGRMVYPVRLGGLSSRPVAIELYVAAAQRIETPLLETRFAAPVLDLPADELSAETKALFGSANYLTRLQADELDPAALTSDLVLTPASSDAAYRAEVVVPREVPIFREYQAIFLALFCVVILTVVVIAIAVWLRRRMDLIAGPDKS